MKKVVYLSHRSSLVYILITFIVTNNMVKVRWFSEAYAMLVWSSQISSEWLPYTQIMGIVNHGTKSSPYISKRSTVRKINNVLYFLSSLRYACCKKCLYITMVTIYPSYAHTLTMVIFLVILSQSHYRINERTTTIAIKQLDYELEISIVR